MGREQKSPAAGVTGTGLVGARMDEASGRSEIGLEQFARAAREGRVALGHCVGLPFNPSHDGPRHIECKANKPDTLRPEIVEKGLRDPIVSGVHQESRGSAFQADNTTGTD
jgi:hypothetical protein